MSWQKGFSPVEPLIVMAIHLVIAIAIPNLLRACFAANESSGVASIHTPNTAEITYRSTHPSVGFALALTNLGGALGVACVSSSTTAVLARIRANYGSSVDSLALQENYPYSPAGAKGEV